MSDQAENTRQRLQHIHEHRLRLEGTVEHALGQINDAGWHRESLQMRQLARDAETFRRLADQCEAKLKELTKETV